MNVLRVRYTPTAASRIRVLHPDIKRIIRDGIRTLCAHPLLGHELRLELSGFRSYRIKSYRILYQINTDARFLEVYFVGHRRDVYESFRALLLKGKQ